MALTFPPSPNVGDTYLSYVWDGTKWGVQVGVGGVAGVSSFNTRVGAVVLALGDVTSATGSGSTAQASLGLATVAASGAYADLSGAPSLASYAPIAAPVFTGDARAVTPAVGDNDTSIATTAFVAAAVAPDRNNVGRNLLHNPLFNIAQRGAGPFTVTGGVSLDRWKLGFAGGSLSVTALALVDADRAAIGDESAVQASQSVCVGTAGAADNAQFTQLIESVSRLSGKTVTVSFWGRATVGTPKVAVELWQGFGTGGSPSGFITGIGSQAFTLSTTWTRYTTTPIAMPSTGGKTLGTNKDDVTALTFWLSAGANSAARAANIGVQSYTLGLWGVQLEVGSTATPLEKPDPQQDLAKCQRFYQTGLAYIEGYGSATVGLGYQVSFTAAMRAIPTVTLSGTTYANASGATVGNQTYTGFSFRVLTTAVGGAYGSSSYSASADL